MGTGQHFGGRGRMGEGSAEVGGNSGAEVCEGQVACLRPHRLQSAGFGVHGIWEEDKGTSISGLGWQSWLRERSGLGCRQRWLGAVSVPFPGVAP